MKVEDIERFRELYAHWWDEKLKSLPNGHVDLLAGLLHQCELLAVDHSDTSPWVTLHFDHLENEGGLFRATAAPLVDFEKWTDGSALALIIALQFFNERQRVICEACGLPGGRHCASPEICRDKEVH